MKDHKGPAEVGKLEVKMPNLHFVGPADTQQSLSDRATAPTQEQLSCCHRLLQKHRAEEQNRTIRGGRARMEPIRNVLSGED